VASLIAAQVAGALAGRLGARRTLASGAGFGVGGFALLAFAHGRPASVGEPHVDRADRADEGRTATASTPP
jgi:hypothetical protein